MTTRPLAARITALGLAAAARHTDPMAAALARIDAEFNTSALRRKDAVRQFLALGPDHIKTRARYEGRARLLSADTLDAALSWTETWLAVEKRKPFRHDTLAIAVLSELRLILRLMRRLGLAKEFPAIVAAVAQPWPRMALVAAE